MIKHRIFSIVTFICSLLCASMAMAQDVYVDVRPKQNPLPAQAALYVDNPGRFFSITLNNLSDEPIPVRLELRVEGPIESQMDIWPNGNDYLAIVADRPIEYYQYLDKGQVRTLADSELNLMFNQYVNNERYAGGKISEIFSNVTEGHVGLLPEGHYGLRVIVKTNYIDQNDRGRVVGENECYFDISYKGSAPSFIEPTASSDGGYLKADFPYQTGRFAWTPPTFSNNRLDASRNILYDFRIMRVTDGMSAYDAATRGAVAYEQKGLMTTFCNVPYSVISTLRRSGDTRYVAQVTARSLVSDASSNQFVMIDNDGKSEIMELYLPPFSSTGQDGDIAIPDDAAFPIIATIQPKASVLNSEMENYFLIPSQLFTVTLKNTSSKEYEVSMLLQFHKGNWGVCPTPAMQHSDRSMTIAAGAEITLDDDMLDYLAGEYLMDYIIAFKAETGFIIGPPSSTHFQDINNFATLRVCEFTGQPVLREKIIGKARCEYTVDPNVELGNDFKIEFTPKMELMPHQPEIYFTNPSRLYNLKITNLTTSNKKLTAILQYVIDEDHSYNGYDEKGDRIDQYFEIGAGDTFIFSDADFDKLFGGFKSVNYQGKSGQVAGQSFSKFEFSDDDNNIARINLFDYEKLLKNKDKKSEALIQTGDVEFVVSDMIKVGRVNITIKPALTEMPFWGDPYIAEPGRLFDISIENTSDATLRLMPQLTYKGVEVDGVTYDYVPLQCYQDNITDIILEPYDKKDLTIDEINRWLGGAQKDFDGDGVIDTVAMRYNYDTEKVESCTDVLMMFNGNETGIVEFRLLNRIMYDELVAVNDPDRINKSLESSAICEFIPNEDATLSVVDVEIKKKSDLMPTNPDAYFDKPEKLWDITLRNSATHEVDVVLYPLIAFNDEYGIEYTTRKLADCKRITLKAGQEMPLTEAEINALFGGRNAYRLRDESNGVVNSDLIPYHELDEKINVGVELTNRFKILVLSDAILSEDREGTLEDYSYGSGYIEWKANDTYTLHDLTITITPKEEHLVDDGKAYFVSPGALFDVEIKNNTNRVQNTVLAISYLFDETGAYYQGDLTNRNDIPLSIGANDTKKLTAKELNDMCGNMTKVYRFNPTTDGFDRQEITFDEIKVNVTSYNRVEINAYNTDSLKTSTKEDPYRLQKAYLGGDKSDFNARSGVSDIGLKVIIEPKSGATFKSDAEPYYATPADLFDVTLINENAVDAQVKLRITYNKRFYGDDRDSVITIKSNTTMKLDGTRLNNICGGYDLYSDKIHELNEKGEYVGTKSGKEVVMKEGVNIVTALLWRKEEKDHKFVVDTICTHDSIFVTSFSQIKIGEYDLTIEDIEKVTGGNKEQEKLKNDCYKGKGYVTAPIMGVKVDINVEWDSIYINWKEKKVTLGTVKSRQPENQFFPAELFSDDTKELLKTVSDSVFVEKVDSIFDARNINEYYRWVQKDIQYVQNLTGGGRVTLPIGISFPMKSGGQCPADIQLAQMTFSEKEAKMDIIGEFVLPETDYLGNVTYDNGVSKYSGDILVFAAQDLVTTPGKFLPESGTLGLLTDITVKDPGTGFDFTFVAPLTRFSEATSGCFIRWENGNFGALSASIKVNVPGGEVVKVVDGVVDETGAPPSIQIDALINDGSDWFGNVSMDSFEIVDLPDFTFTVAGTKAGDTGIYYDHSRKTTRGSESEAGGLGRVEFHPDYYDKTLGGSGKPASDKTAYNAWQGFYFKELGVELPHYDFLNNTTEERPKITVNNLMYDETGFSMSAEVKNVIDYSTEKAGGWRFSIDSIALSVLQGNFRDTGFKGKIGIPLLSDKSASNDTVTVPAAILYKAKVIAFDKKSNAKKGTSTTFELDQEMDSMAINCFLAEVYLENSKTWFWINHNTTRPEDRQTLFDFSLGGSIKINCGDFSLPEIPFSGMGYSNCTAAEKESAEEQFKTSQQSTTPSKPDNPKSQIKSPDGSKTFSLGDWDFNKNDASSEESYFQGFPVYIKDLSLDIQGTDKVGIKFNCGLSVMGSKKAGVSADVGLGIYAKINWDDFSLAYDTTEVSDLQLQGHFGGVVTISGGLEFCKTEEKEGFATKAGAPLELGIKGLFNLQIAGGYYKVKKTEEDYALDTFDEKKDAYFHAGYFLGKASKMNVPMGPVALTSVMGGLFINYGTTAGGVSGTDKAFYEAIQENAKIKYKTYGGAFGIGLSSVGSEALLKGDLNFMLLIDINGSKVRVPEFHMQGNVHAICANPDSEEGLINSSVDLIFQDNTDENDPQPDQCKRFNLNMTTTAGATIDQLYEQFTGEKLEVPEAVGDFLSDLDAKNASDENKGEGGNTADTSSKTESKGFLKAGCSAEIKLELEIRNYPYATDGKKTFWHIYVGKPTPDNERCRITFIDFEIGKDKPVGLWAKVYANAYLCLGNELPDNGALPPIPDKVLEALGMKGADGKAHPENMSKLEAEREDQMSGFKNRGINGGIMVGAALGAEIGCNAVFCYASVEGMLGFDMVLKKFSPGERCGDGTLMGGTNGYYATGQLYAMLKGELGLMLDLWIYKGKIPLVDMTLGALLQGGFPNPTWVYGRLRASGSVLGGLIKFNSTIEMKAGRVCVPAFGNPLDDVKIFGDFNPGDEDLENGWAAENAVSPYSTVSFTTNMKMGKYLPLVDQTRTANNIGMDIPEEGEKAEDKTVLRTYVFYLGRVDDEGEPISSVPTFEITQYNDNSTSDSRPETDARYIECTNPSGDKENFTLITGSLKENKCYRVVLSGYCKEVVNGKEINPIFNDSTTNYQDKEEVWDQLQTVYFRTGEFSKNIVDDVAGFTPMAVDDKYNYYTATLEDVTNPTVMMRNDRESYWNNPDYEFSASLTEYVERENEDGVTVGEWVYPDAKDGLYRGQKSAYQDLEIKLVTEKGVDEYGDEYFYQTVKLAQPLPKEAFKKGGRYKFEITRFNRKLMTDQLNLIEERYEDMMNVIQSDKETFEKELDKMNDDEKAVAKQLYDYYQSMEEEYGENTAEQRKVEFMEQAKQNSDMFVEVVWSHEYTYNGIATFQDYVRTKFDEGFDAYRNSSIRIGTSYKYFSLPLQYMYNGRLFRDYSFTRDNNPYYAMNYWHSKAFVWYGGDSGDKDGKLDKFKYCDEKILANVGISYDTYTPEASNLKFEQPTLKVSYPPYWEYRIISLGIKGYNWGSKRSDYAVQYMLDPIYGKEERATRWHNVPPNVYYLGQTMTSDIQQIYDIDCDAVINFESRLHLLWSNSTKYAHTYNLSGKNLEHFKTFNTNKAKLDSYSYGIATTKQGGLITFPEWQMGLMLGADNGHIKEVKGTRAQSVASYRYLMGSYDGTIYQFDKSLFLKNFKQLQFRVRYPDGYNQVSSTYGVRPEHQNIRDINVLCNLTEKGLEGGDFYRANYITYAVEDKIHFSDPEFRRYLTNNFDTDKDGSLSSAELNAITQIDVSYPAYKVESFDGLSFLPNLKIVGLYNFNYAQNGVKAMKVYFDFNELPQLEKLTLVNTNCDNITLDLGKAKNLKTFCVENSDLRRVRFNENSNLTKLEVRDCYDYFFDVDVVCNYRNLTYLDISGSGLNNDTVSIVGLTKLTHINVKPHSQKGNQRVTRKLLAEPFSQYTEYLSGNTFKTLNSHTGKAAGCKVDVVWYSIDESLLDENLCAALKDILKVSTLSGQATKDVTSLNLKGRKIKSLKYLEYFCPKLEELNVEDNQLKELDLSGYNFLIWIYAGNNNISYFDIANENNITTIDVSNNQISALPAHKMGKVTTLDCSENLIEELYVNSLKSLSIFDCSSNLLTEMIMDQVTGLTDVNISNNNFSTIKMPTSTSYLKKFVANNCLVDGLNLKLDLSSCSKLSEVELSDNPGLTYVWYPLKNIESIIAKNCNLTGTFNFYPGIAYDDNFGVLEHIDMSNNPNLTVNIYSDNFGANYVKYVNFTGCEVGVVDIGGIPYYAQGLQVRVGVPQRTSGVKVSITFSDVNWFERWEEWMKYPENRYTVIAFAKVGDTYEAYDDNQNAILEEITDEDQQMREDFGEKLYASLLKKKNEGKAVEEQSRAFHVADAKALTELNATNMDINHLNKVIKWMPGLTNIYADGNNLTTVNLKSASVKLGRFQTTMKFIGKIDNLSLANIGTLESLILPSTTSQYVNNLDLTNSTVSNTTFNNAISQVKNRLILSNPGGTASAYELNNSSSAVDVLYYGNTSKKLNVNSCELDSLVLTNANMVLPATITSTTNISIDNIVVRDDAKTNFGTGLRVNTQVTIAKNTYFENFVLTANLLETWLKLTSDKLTMNNCRMPIPGSLAVATTSTSKTKQLVISNMTTDVSFVSCNFDKVLVENGVITLNGRSTNKINIDQFIVRGNTTINFQTADMMLMWLYGWQTQNPGVTVNYKVSAMTSEKESLAAMANAFISSGQLDLNSMSQAEIINALNVLIEKGFLPKGDRYDEIVEKLNNNKKLVEDVELEPIEDEESEPTETPSTGSRTTNTVATRPSTTTRPSTSGTSTRSSSTTTRRASGTTTSSSSTTGRRLPALNL